MGASAFGMSTVPEIIVAFSLGMEVFFFFYGSFVSSVSLSSVSLSFVSLFCVFVGGKVGDVDVYCMAGRLHRYEGIAPCDISFSVRFFLFSFLFYSLFSSHFLFLLSSFLLSHFSPTFLSSQSPECLDCWGWNATSPPTQQVAQERR